MAKIIAFANQKGGVGKTTSAINVAAALGLKRKNTLLVDFDPQGNSTSGVGIRKSQVKNTIYDALVGKASPHDCIIKTEYKNLSVMPSELSLAAAELELAEDADDTDRDGELRRQREPVTLNRGSGYQDVVVTRETYPVYLGAVVVCQGAGSGGVRLAVTEAVAALTGLPADRITVVQWDS